MHIPLKMKICLVVMISLCFLSAAQGEVAIIVSAKNPVSAMGNAQVADIFLGRTRKFPRQSAAVPVNLPESSATRDEFYVKEANKMPPLLKSYWSRLIFTGEAQPPREVDSMAVMKKMIADNPDYIVYLDINAVDPSVRIVLLLR